MDFYEALGELRKARKLFNLEIKEISGVDHPANRRKFLIMKTASEPKVEDEKNKEEGGNSSMGTPTEIFKEIEGGAIALRERPLADVNDLQKFMDTPQGEEAYARYSRKMEQDWDNPPLPPEQAKAEKARLEKRQRVKEEIEQRVVALQKSGGLSRGEALTIIFEREPDLYAQYSAR